MSKIREWSCYGTVTGGIYLGTVKAKTKKKALKLAEELDNAGIVIFCHECSEKCEDAMVTRIVVEPK